ncbi:MAG: hypothetical protein JWP45_1091 [Mucilaginibacter sp.]|nr:hypothetical protein [Mucilaginibacter sp.]
MTLRDVRRVDLNLNDANPRIVNFTTGYGKNNVRRHQKVVNENLQPFLLAIK